MIKSAIQSTENRGQRTLETEGKKNPVKKKRRKNKSEGTRAEANRRI